MQSHRSRTGSLLDRFTIQHALLLVVLFGVALLLGDDTLLPTGARIPGMLILAAIAGWLGMTMIPRRPHREPILVRASHPSIAPRRPSRG